MIRQFSRKYSLIATGIILLIGVGIVLISYFQFQDFNASLSKQNTIKNEIAQANKLLEALINAETGQGGYIITGKKEYLEPYNHALQIFNSPDIQLFLNKLNDNPQFASFNLKDLIGKKLSELQDSINARRNLGFEAAQKRMNTDVGKSIMDKIRFDVGEIVDQKEARLVQENKKEVTQSRNTLWVVVLGETMIVMLMLACLFMLFKDISKRIDAEKSLNNLNALYHAAQEKADEANKAKSLFLANISHDLRTPLNSIIGFSLLMQQNKKGHLDSEDLSFLRRISENGNHLLNLINTILDLTMIEESKLMLKKTSVNLSHFITNILEELEGYLMDKNLKFKKDIPEPINSLVTDEQKLRQVIVNLIGNSIKFTSEGTITIKVAKDSLNDPVSISIIDTGKGISSENLTKIFSPFYQVESIGERQHNGSGLGLSISEAICTSLGYRIEVSSTLGKGSEFSVILKEPMG